MLGSRKAQRTIGGEEMKKDTLLNAIIISLSIIAGVSIIIAAFMEGTINGFIAIGCVSAFYTLVLCAYKDFSNYG